MKLPFNKIKRFNIVVFFFRLSAIGYGSCEKCGLPWKYCQNKSVPTSYGSGTFATCQYCWDHSSLYELKTYYTNVYHDQSRGIIGTGYTMDHTLQHLLDSVEKEYNKENIKRRKQKVRSIRRTLKKNRKKNVTLLRQD